MAKILIRKARKSDLKEIMELARQLSKSDYRYDKKVDLLWPDSTSGKQHYRKKVFNQKGICFVADFSGEVVGYATASKRKKRNIKKIGRAKLENLYIKRNFRNHGLGKKLIRSFLDWAEEINAEKVFVDAYIGNKRGISFYKRAGFSLLNKPIK